MSEPATIRPVPRPAPRSSGQRGRRLGLLVLNPSIRRPLLEFLPGGLHLEVYPDPTALPPEPAAGPDLLVIDGPALTRLPHLSAPRPGAPPAPVLAVVLEQELSALCPLLASAVQDFIVHPFAGAELRLRVETALRRCAVPPDDSLRVGEFSLDLRRNELHHRGRSLPLTGKEAGLFYALARRAGLTATRDELLDEVWGADFDGTSNVLEVYIRSLRRKIEPNPRQPSHIQTVRGVGYRLVLPPANPARTGGPAPGGYDKMNSVYS